MKQVRLVNDRIASHEWHNVKAAPCRGDVQPAGVLAAKVGEAHHNRNQRVCVVVAVGAGKTSSTSHPTTATSPLHTHQRFFRLHLISLDDLPPFHPPLPTSSPPS